MNKQEFIRQFVANFVAHKCAHNNYNQIRRADETDSYTKIAYNEAKQSYEQLTKLEAEDDRVSHMDIHKAITKGE